MGKKELHEFFAVRGIDEAHLVLRIDDYETSINSRGGFSPDQYPHRGGGFLWPDMGLAVSAAEHIVRNAHPQHVYGVFTLSRIIEVAQPPVLVTKVKT